MKSTTVKEAEITSQTD